MRPVPAAPCLALIHAFEGSNGSFEPNRVQDPGGLWEIGWSHKLLGQSDPLWDVTITRAEADALALEDLGKAAAGVCLALGPVVDELTDGQYAVCLDFAYNEGVGRFCGSTFCHYIVIGNMALAPLELPKWVYGHVDGVEQVLPGLVRRRQAELDVWKTSA